MTEQSASVEKIARLAACSKATVSRALSGSVSVSARLRQKIRLFDGFCHKSHLFHARNFGELINFQLEVFTIPKAIRLFDQPADFIVEAFHFSIADMPKSPETDHSVKFIPDCPSHAFSFRNAGLFCKFDPAMMHAAPERFEQATAATVTGCQGGASMPGMAALPAAFGYLAAETTFTLPPVFAMRAAAILPLQRVVDSGTRER